MEVQNTPTVAWSAFFLVFLLVAGIGVVATAANAFAAFRKGGVGAGLLFTVLFGLAAFGLCMMLYLARSGHADAHATVVQEPAIQHHLEAERLHLEAVPPVVPMVPPPSSGPVEAPRPAREDAAAAAPGEAGRLTSVPSAWPPHEGAAPAKSGDDLVHATPSSRLPEWLRSGGRDEGDRRLVVVSGQQYADATTAWQDAIAQASDLLREDFTREFRPVGHWILDAARINAVRERYTEEIHRTAGENEFTVYRTHLLVELSPQVRGEIRPIWREQVTKGRSMIVGGSFALLTVLVGLVAGYIRLDDRTQGHYRWRLRFGTLGTALLAAAVVLFVLRTYPIASTARPAQPPDSVDLPVAPSDARTSQLETSVDNQDQERFREVADRMVKAINAADYEGVRQDFNKTMLDTFPVEKCRTFFDKEISGRFGKINTLEPPQFKSAAVAVWVARCERGALDFTLVLDKHGQVAGMLFRPRSDLPPVAPMPPSLEHPNT